MPFDADAERALGKAYIDKYAGILPDPREPRRLSAAGFIQSAATTW